MIPPAFATPKVLRSLNIAAVGLALSASTAAIFGAMAPDFSGIVVGAPTLVMGMLWAWILRLPNTVGSTKIRWGWLASVPLAALNAGLALGVVMATYEPGDRMANFLGGVALGATFGLFVWVPALLLTLLAFGVPIARSQKLAKSGLAGEERGEWLVGIVCTVLALAALALSFAQKDPRGWTLSSALNLAGLARAGVVFMRIAGALGMLLGGAATLLAANRESKRRVFVADAEQGKIPGYRVDVTPDGKALVRVSSMGQGYRVSDFTEEVVLLDEEGRATETRMAQRL